jgi:hypothetical protein
MEARRPYARATREPLPRHGEVAERRIMVERKGKPERGDAVFLSLSHGTARDDRLSTASDSINYSEKERWQYCRRKRGS